MASSNRKIRAQFIANSQYARKQNNSSQYIIGVFIMAIIFAVHFFNSHKSQSSAKYYTPNLESVDASNIKVENPLSNFDARERPPQTGDVWEGCNDARAAGTAPIYSYEPGYDIKMDGDGDGIACEKHRN